MLTWTQDVKSLKIPHYFKKGGCLIGAAVGDIQPSELEGFRSDMRSTGPIYNDLTFLINGQDVIDLYQNSGNTIREQPYFFPPCGKDQRAFDCLPKALN
jgi:hypothetical protein